MTAQILAQRLDELLRTPGTSVALVTRSPSGDAHPTGDVEVLPGDEGRLLYREYLESSSAAHHLTRALWYDQSIWLLVICKGQHLKVRGLPVRAHITGPLYEREYLAAEQRGRDELASVWEIRIEEITDETPTVLRANERRLRPFFTHLDRLAKTQ